MQGKHAQTKLEILEMAETEKIQQTKNMEGATNERKATQLLKLEPQPHTQNTVKIITLRICKPVADPQREQFKTDSARGLLDSEQESHLGWLPPRCLRHSQTGH